MWIHHKYDVVYSFPVKDATTKWMESIMGQVDNIEKSKVATKILKHESQILFGNFANSNDI
jgi:hypothetical protein